VWAQVFDFKTVVLVGGGIGVTPFASILRRLVIVLLDPYALARAAFDTRPSVRTRRASRRCRSRRCVIECDLLFFEPHLSSPPPHPQVYFFWISRDKTAFEWFGELLAALEEAVDPSMCVGDARARPVDEYDARRFVGDQHLPDR
jgi:hypothetical protein